MMIIQSYILAKLFKFNWVITFLCLICFFPYSFMHGVDFGTISFLVTSIYLFYFIGKKWSYNFQNLQNSFFYTLLAGLLIFICLWIKLVFILLLPAALLCLFVPVLSILFNRFKSIENIIIFRKFFFDLFFFLLSAVVPSGLLFFAKDRSGQTYWQEYITIDPHKHSFESFFDFSALLNKLQNFASYFVNPLKASHRVFIENHQVTWEGALLCCIFGAVIIFFITNNYKDKRCLKEFALLLFCFIITISFLSLSKNTWAFHHAILAWPFLVLSMAFCIKRMIMSKRICFIILIFLFLNLNLFIQSTKLTCNREQLVLGFLHEHVSSTSVLFNSFLNNFSDQYVFICVDWGMYYIKSLYGPKNQCVLYIHPLFNTDQIKSIKKILEETKRKPMFIFYKITDSNKDLIMSEFDGLHHLKTNFDSEGFEAWAN